MRRIPSISLAVLLLGAFLFPLVAPAFASASSWGVPACCRRNGKHHCGMVQAESEDVRAGGPRVSAPLETCPFGQRSPGVAHHELSVSSVAATNAVALLEEPTGASQAECLRRISFDRSRQKRGPPVVLS